jgi:hypothetical protein
VESYEDWRITVLDFTCDGLSEEEIKVYEDSGRKYLIDSYQPYPAGSFSIDVGHLDGDRVYLEIGEKHDAIGLTGKTAAEVGDSFLDCTITDISRIPLGPPHYMTLNLEYTGSAGPLSLTAYDGRWKDVIGIYQVASDFNTVFTINGRGLPKGYLGENLVLEYGPAVLSE